MNLMFMKGIGLWTPTQRQVQALNLEATNAYNQSKYKTQVVQTPKGTIT